MRTNRVKQKRTKRVNRVKQKRTNKVKITKHNRTKQNRTNRVNRTKNRSRKQYSYGGSIIQFPDLDNTMIPMGKVDDYLEDGNNNYYAMREGDKFREWFRKIINKMYNWCLTTVPVTGDYNKYNAIDGNQHRASRSDSDTTGSTNPIHLQAWCDSTNCKQSRLFDWIALPNDKIRQYRNSDCPVLNENIKGWRCSSNGLNRLSIPWRCTHCWGHNRESYWSGFGTQAGEDGMASTEEDVSWLRGYTIQEKKDRTKLGLTVVPIGRDTPPGEGDGGINKEYYNAWILPSARISSVKNRGNFKRNGIEEYQFALEAMWGPILEDEGWLKRFTPGPSRKSQAARAAALGTVGTAAIMAAPAVFGGPVTTAGYVAAYGPVLAEPALRHVVVPGVKSATRAAITQGKKAVNVVKAAKQSVVESFDSIGDMIDEDTGEEGTGEEPDRGITYYINEFYTYILDSEEYKTYMTPFQITELKEILNIPKNTDMSGLRMIELLRTRYLNNLQSNNYGQFNLLDAEAAAHVVRIINGKPIETICYELHAIKDLSNRRTIPGQTTAP